jgi:hypothetical protein
MQKKPRVLLWLQFAKSQVQEHPTPKATLANCNILGLTLSHGWHRHYKRDAVLYKSMLEDILTTS